LAQMVRRGMLWAVVGLMRLAALNYHFVPTEIMRALFRRLCASYVIINHFSAMLCKIQRSRFFQIKGALPSSNFSV
jgi:hypothetical protein